MSTPIEFEALDGYACFRAAGDVTFNEAVGIISRVISEASGQGVQRLLVDTTRLRGFPYPTTWERYFMAEKWAANSRGLRLSLVSREDLLDPYRFGIMVARNRGLIANVFTSEPEAIGWLLDPNPE